MVLPPYHLVNGSVKDEQLQALAVRLCSVRVDGARRVGVSDADGAVRLVSPATGDLRDLIPDLLSGRSPALKDEPVADPDLGPPVLPGKVVAIGLNYRDHADESRVQAPERPLVFSKFPSSVIGPDDAIVVDAALTERVDWEVELGVVIGERMRNVASEDALSHVLGFTVGNDVSARDVQFSDVQWTRGKSLDTFCPLGPHVVTLDEAGDGRDLHLTTTLNGEVMQDDSTRSMIFDIPTLLAFCSRSFTLEPGDVLLTGTPSGCGEFMDPQRFLTPGDVVEVSIEGIGSMSNPVVAADGAATT